VELDREVGGEVVRQLEHVGSGVLVGVVDEVAEGKGVCRDLGQIADAPEMEHGLVVVFVAQGSLPALQRVHVVPIVFGIDEEIVVSRDEVAVVLVNLRVVGQLVPMGGCILFSDLLRKI